MASPLHFRRIAVAGIGVLLAVGFSAAAMAEAIAVQCAIDQYRSSFAPRPDSFTILVDTEAGSVTTYFGTMPLKLKRREFYGAAPAPDGWQTHVAINRNTGRLVAGTDKLEGRKHHYTELTGLCILPQSLKATQR
jgi:hypothetical protein